MAEKVFRTYDEMIQCLASRGVDMSTTELRSYSKKLLQHEGYYNLINGYKMLFLERKENKEEEDKYKDGTTVKEIYALYNFDRRLRSVFMKYILLVETNVKSLISYFFSQSYGHDNYMIYANFDVGKKDASKNITALFSEIQRQISTRYSDPSISHYLKRYGYIPLWVLNNILTLGTISKFYSQMKQKERQSVAKVFHVSDAELESALFYLSKIRNFCAHGNRLYCFRSKAPIITTKWHLQMDLPQNESGEYLLGKRDLLAAVLLLKSLLSKTEFKRLVKNVHHELDVLRINLKVLSEQDILSAMGFPESWKKEILKYEE